MVSPITLRPPSTLTKKQPSSSPPNNQFNPPPLSFLLGTWHVTHSTLPMWKSNRNVTITYTQLPSSSSSSSSSSDQHPQPLPRLDDLVQYQGIGNAKVKSVKGVDTPSGSGTDTGAWDWRGRGWLMIAGSHWEILGWGSESGSGSGDGARGGENDDGRHEEDDWAVTYFAKTLFTPAGIDLYSRRKEGLSEDMVRAVKEALQSMEYEELQKLAGKIFEVQRD